MVIIVICLVSECDSDWPHPVPTTDLCETLDVRICVYETDSGSLIFSGGA